jgi:hypothetical protein
MSVAISELTRGRSPTCAVEPSTTQDWVARSLILRQAGPQQSLRGFPCRAPLPSLRRAGLETRLTTKSRWGHQQRRAKWRRARCCPRLGRPSGRCRPRPSNRRRRICSERGSRRGATSPSRVFAPCDSGPSTETVSGWSDASSGASHPVPIHRRQHSYTRRKAMLARKGAQQLESRPPP